MKLFLTSSLTQNQKETICYLWNQEFTEGVKYDQINAFDTYLNKWENPSHILLLDKESAVLGWMFIFDRDGERWFSMLLDKAVQGKGYGSKLIQEAQKIEPQLNGWVIDDDKHLKQDGSTYRSPIGFYLKNGFFVIKEARFESEQLSAVKIVWQK